ncbi:MAG: response regulator [Phycisphaerales bacterium]|nr:MAG: response regulator [Phycisphaerales bacterium]
MDPSHTPQSRTPQNRQGTGHASAEESVTPLNIVALDDDPDFREYIQGVLDADGHRVRVVATPDEFYRACEAELPDVVLLDIKMGRHSGEEVLSEIRKRWTKLCVLVVTGYPTMEGMRTTFKQDVFDYLSKPFTIAELRRVLAQATAALGLGDAPQDRLRREVGHQIRMSRTAKGWTLRDLSEASGVSVSQLSTIERGSVFPSLESIVAIATALGSRPSAWFIAAGL